MLVLVSESPMLRRMRETWFHLDSGIQAPEVNMAVDEALLEASASLGAPVLRTYGWSLPAATFGYFQRYDEIAALMSIRPLIRRPTGGGLVPHDADWTYSVVIPPGHARYRVSAETSYRLQHEWLRSAFAAVGVPTELAPCCDARGPGQCFIGAEKHDLMHRGLKIAGAAQRRNRLGLLIQGSVQPKSLEVLRKAWEGALREVCRDVDWRPLVVTPSLEERVGVLVAEKYGAAIYNQRR